MPVCFSTEGQTVQAQSALPQTADMSGGAGSVTDGLREKVRFCEGFSDAGQRYALRKHRAGVREATMHEVALAQWCNALAVPRGEPYGGLSTAAATGSVRSNGRMRVRAVVRGTGRPARSRLAGTDCTPTGRSEDHAASRGRARWLPVNDQQRRVPVSKG
jgi:hypothetical protein